MHISAGDSNHFADITSYHIYGLYHDMIEAAAGASRSVLGFFHAGNFHIDVGDFTDGGIRIAGDECQFGTVLLCLMCQ